MSHFKQTFEDAALPHPLEGGPHLAAARGAIRVAEMLVQRGLNTLVPGTTVKLEVGTESVRCLMEAAPEEEKAPAAGGPS